VDLAMLNKKFLLDGEKFVNYNSVSECRLGLTFMPNLLKPIIMYFSFMEHAEQVQQFRGFVIFLTH
jgi:hypothetical protein